MAATERKSSPHPIFRVLTEINKTQKVLWIPGEVPSLKNSKEIVTIKTSESICCGAPIHRISKGSFLCSNCHKPTKHKTQPRLIPSKAVVRYTNETKEYYNNAAFSQRYKQWFAGKEYPIYMGMYLVRKSASSWDFNNVTQIIQDLLVKYKHIEKDDVNFLIPVYLGHHKDADNPGIIIIPIEKFTETIIDNLKLYNDKST